MTARLADVAGIAVPDAPPLLAVGADTKASLCLAYGGRAHLVTMPGDLQDLAVFNRFLDAIEAMEAAHDVLPTLAACDAHPGYISSSLAQESGVPVLEVQHHHAHIASVMAEHGAVGPILGVAMDGAGYGEDGAVWGCEFLLCRTGSCRRLAHLDYTPLVGGDQAARDAAQTAVCHLAHAELDIPEALHPDAPLLRSALTSDLGCADSSSMGRLFDAVSALLGLGSENLREGQCAVLLQQAAERARDNGVRPADVRFAVSRKRKEIRIDHIPVIRAAADWRDHEPEAFALGFHLAVAEMTAEVLGLLGRAHRVETAAFSGGVFQNALLRELCRERAVREGFRVLMNVSTPAHDGGVALGQAYVAAHRHAKILRSGEP